MWEKDLSTEGDEDILGGDGTIVVILLYAFVNSQKQKR